jgi:single-strand DNA-binding protein
MNLFIFNGNITKDIELRTTTSGKQVASFSVALNNGKDDTTFINCVAWEKTAELLNSYCKKGDRLCGQGRIVNRSYDKDGVKVYVGRVYEYKAFGVQEPINMFGELAEANGAVPKDWITMGSTYEDYVSVVKTKTGSASDKWSLVYETAMAEGQYIVQRIAKVTSSDGVYTVEQIHMGDVSWSEHNIAPFTTVRAGTSTVIYIPANSVVINGQD